MRASSFVVPALLLAGHVFGAESRVKMDDLPAAVRKTVREQTNGAKVHGLSKEVENGKTYYEVELRAGGHAKDLLIDSSGSVVEIEEQVGIDSLPAAVKGALEKRAAKGRIVSIESVTKDRSVVGYEARIRTAGKTSEIRLSPDGAPIQEP